MDATSTKPGRRFKVWWLLLPFATALAAGYEVWLRPTLAQRALPTGAAEWIWADVAPDAGWVGFLAVRDFWIDEIPEGSVTMLLAADEEYVAYLNGLPVGSGSYRTGGGVDGYEVSKILVEGENRLLIELRSAHSVGGLLLSMSSSDGHIVTSDASWKVLREYREKDKWPGTPVDGLKPVRVWGPPPAGRWGWPRPVVPRPRLQRQLLARRPLPASLVRIDGRGPWRELPAEPVRERPLGRWVTFDFGRSVSGFVNLVPAKRGGARGLFWIGTDEPPQPRSSPPDGRLFSLVGQGSWTDSTPRRFRYVTVVSLTEISGARAFVLKPELESTLLIGERPPAGILGLDPPDLRSPVEDEFWREFESLASVGSGEGS